jgi:amidase
VASRRGNGTDDWTPLSLMPSAVTQTHRQWLGVSERRERYRAAWDEFFQSCDVLLVPVAPTTALAHDHRPFEARTICLRGRQYAYMQQTFWCALATLGHLPAAVIPAGVADDGLPVGLQIIGPYLGERTVLEFAAFAEAVLGGFRPPPALSGNAAAEGGGP